MTSFIYTATVPTIVRSLNNLRAILVKAEAYAETQKIDPTVLINARLYPNMFPLSTQVQIATDIAKGAVSRLAGVEPPKYEDNEASFPELLARIDKTINLLESFSPEQLDGSEDKAIALPLHDRTLNFTGLSYLLDFVLPNIYFHVTTTYAILRHNGLAIGKHDFLGDL